MAQPLLFGQRPSVIQPALLGDIVDHPDGTQDPARRVPDMLALFVDAPDLPGVPADDPVLDLVAAASLAQRGLISRVDGLPVVRVDRD
jgi:hypothetical protein